MNTDIIDRYCRNTVLGFPVWVSLTVFWGLSFLSLWGCGKPTESASEIVPIKSTSEEKGKDVTNELYIEELQSKLELARREFQGMEPVLAKRNIESRGLYSQLTSSFGKLSESEREEVKNALKQGNVKEKFPNRNDVIHIATTFDELRDVEASLKKYQTLSSKYLQEIEEGEALVKKLQRKIEDEKVFGTSDILANDSNESTTQLLDRLEALRVETTESAQKDDAITPTDVNNAQESSDLLDKIVEEANTATESSAIPIVQVDSQTPQEEKRPEPTTSQGVDVASAAKYAQAGHEAFEKKDYLLAKEKGDIALTFDPNCEGAKKLLEKTKVELDKLAQTVQEGSELFDSGKYGEALEKAREVKSLCVNYPDADALEKKTIIPMIAEGKNDLERNDGDAALEKARQVLQSNPDDADAKELEIKAIKSLVDALVTAGWEAYGLNDKQKAFSKAQEALGLNPNDENAKKLYEECDPFNNTEPGSRATLLYNGIEFAFRYCPPGSFMMGSPEDEAGRLDYEEQRTEAINEGFWICETEVTQEQWDSVGMKKNEGCYCNGAKYPVESISWNESVDFIKKLNDLGIATVGWRFDLPTEVQWEYACRAGTTGSTYGASLDDCAWYAKNSGSHPHEVAGMKPNNWGIYDMLGNVYEWTNSNSEQVVAGKSCWRVCGGCWNSEAQLCRPAHYFAYQSTFSNGIIGFRCVLVRHLSK